MISFTRILSAAILLVFLCPRPTHAAEPFSLVVTDASTKVSLDGAAISVDGRPVYADALGHGMYTIHGISNGRHRLDIARRGYRTVSIIVDVPGSRTIALYLQNSSTELQTIASVHSTELSGGDRGTVLNTTIGNVDLDRTATFRLADALLNLPEISASAITASATNTAPSTGQTTTPLLSGPGSYVQMSVRGFGTIESPALIDGHPIAEGVDLGFDFQDAPTFGLGSVFVGYGTDAASLFGVGGAGAIDMRTLSPTLHPSFDVLQGAGSYGRLATALKTTGTTADGRFGWAFAYGVEGTGGPLSGNYYAPTASIDPSNPADTRAATYAFSDDTNRRNLLGKLRFVLGNGTTLVLKGFDATAWADGTGDNSDGIYKPLQVATAQGSQLLAAKSPNDPCPAGAFTAYSQLVDPNSGAPLPQSVPCQTPQQYGVFNQGFQGAGPHYVAERTSDYSATLSTTYQSLAVNLDLFTNSYLWNYNRDGALPYSNPQYPFGAMILPYLSVNQLVVNSGGTLTVDKPLGDHDPYISVRMMTNTNLFSAGPGTATAPIVGSSSTAFGDHWTIADGRTELDASGAFTTNDATRDGSWFDPHLSVSQILTSRDRVRFSAGASTVAPAALWLDSPFTPTDYGTFQSSIDCSGPNSVGSVPSNALLPERIADQEMTVTHEWGGGAFTTVDLYNAWLSNKIYAAAVPVSQLPAGTIPDSELAPYQNALVASCGNASTLAATGNFNIGSVHAKGADLMGRIPVPHVRRLGFDYSYSLESSMLSSVTSPWFLPYNLTFIPGSQLPGVPLRKYSLDLDYAQPNGIDATLRRYWLSANNPSNLPAYGFSELAIGVPVAQRLRAHVTIENVFNEEAGGYALSGMGIPMPLNHFATPADAVPYTGYGATVRALLAPRTLLLTFDFKA